MAYGTAAQVKAVTGVKFAQVGEADDGALDTLLGVWLGWIASHINTRLELATDLDSGSVAFDGITSIAVLAVAKIVNVAKEERKAAIQRNDDFDVRIVDTSRIMEKLSADLAPFEAQVKRDTRPTGTSRVSMFIAGHPAGRAT